MKTKKKTEKKKEIELKKARKRKKSNNLLMGSKLIMCQVPAQNFLIKILILKQTFD